jgi:hypothetical protein
MKGNYLRVVVLSLVAGLAAFDSGAVHIYRKEFLRLCD